MAVPYTSDVNVPVPYMRWNQDAAIIVVANRNTDADAHLKLNIPLEKLGQTSGAQYKVTDLWNGGTPLAYAARALSEFFYTVKRDKAPRGGISLIKIERID